MMKKLIYLIVLLLILAGCSNQNATSTPATQQAQNESSENSYQTFERDDINTEHSDDAPHDSRLGEKIETTDETIPADMVGTWKAVEGIPEGLEGYNIIIDADANTVLDVENSNGDRSRSVATCIVNGNIYDLVDSNGYLILELSYEDGKLVTEGLEGGKTTVFEKTDN